MAASAANTAPLMRTTTAETAAQSDVAAFGRLKDPLQASQLGQELGGDNASTADSTGAHGTAAEAVALGHDDLSNSMPPSFVSVPAAPVPQAPAATNDDVSIELVRLTKLQEWQTGLAHHRCADVPSSPCAIHPFPITAYSVRWPPTPEPAPQCAGRRRDGADIRGLARRCVRSARVSIALLTVPSPVIPASLGGRTS